MAEYWGFAALVVGMLVVGFVVTRVIGRAGRNNDSTHGGGASFDVTSGGY